MKTIKLFLLICFMTILCCTVACNKNFERETEPLKENTSETNIITNHVPPKEVNAEYIANRSIHRTKKDNGYYFLFSLQDENQNDIKVEATVKMRIVNSDGIEVYKKTINITPSNFGGWSNAYKSYIAASIYIYDTEIAKGTTGSGVFYYEVTTKGGTFSESSFEINGLPLLETTMILPECPTTLLYSSRYTGERTYLITDIKYKVTEIGIYFYFSGEKTYDSEGDYDFSYCALRYNIYDAKGEIITTGYFNTKHTLKVGDNFVDNEGFISLDHFEIGETYIFELIDEVK